MPCSSYAFFDVVAMLTEYAIHNTGLGNTLEVFGQLQYAEFNFCSLFVQLQVCYLIFTK
jgi:hypothetical protein